MSKQTEAQNIYNEFGSNPRSDVIAIFMTNLNVSKAHASTMYQTCKVRGASVVAEIPGVAPFVLYDKDTTILTSTVYFKSLGAAKAAITKMRKDGKDASNVAIAGYSYFSKNIELMETVKNLMTGAAVVQPVNTPRCCDVSSELCWSM